MKGEDFCVVGKDELGSCDVGFGVELVVDFDCYVKVVVLSGWFFFRRFVFRGRRLVVIGRGL